ncbi:hypothetical protein H312_03504 [Anncaliia algerae PRA339]|uniref:Uncharacterized protein n=1 Tax=Anncaliia algerae PRA339 TaxID=1288291 RepID=A0A059EVT5_9MICR|nr:hypothetical protein H312_03504 [Anncaliia algerae PRA339]
MLKSCWLQECLIIVHIKSLRDTYKPQIKASLLIDSIYIFFTFILCHTKVNNQMFAFLVSIMFFCQLLRKFTHFKISIFIGYKITSFHQNLFKTLKFFDGIIHKVSFFKILFLL